MTPDPSIVPPHTVDPIFARAWMLYTLTQPGLQHPNRYMAQRLRKGAAPPERFVAWARLSPEEWRLLWRAHRYGGPYQEALPADLDLEAWGRMFGDVLPDGPFGDDGRDVADVVSQAIAATAEAAADAPPRVGVRADGATVWLIPEDEQAADRLRARLPQIAAWLRGRGVLHRLDVATPERLRSGDSRASIWRIALDDLRLQMTQATFDTWLRDSMLLACRDDALVVGVRNTYARDWLENRLYDVIQRTLRRLTGREVEVEFVVVGRGRMSARRLAPATASATRLAGAGGRVDRREAAHIRLAKRIPATSGGIAVACPARLFYVLTFRPGGRCA